MAAGRPGRGDERQLERIAQEAITNAAHHAKAKRVEVAPSIIRRLRCAPGLGRRVRFATTPHPEAAGHYGLLSMKERADSIRAAFHWQARPDAARWWKSESRCNTTRPWPHRCHDILHRVLCVDDHPMITEGIASAINRQADMRVIGCAATSQMASTPSCGSVRRHAHGLAAAR